MSVNFKDVLSVEQQTQILSERLVQFAAEALQISLNKTIAEKTGNEDGVKEATQTLNVLETAIAVYQEELNSLTSGE